MISRCVILACVALCSHAAEASLMNAFEFNTPGDNEGWTHNGANGGGSGATAVTAGSGEGVLTGVAPAANGDLRVLYNPDLVLDTGLFTSWSTIDVRFRQLDATGAPRALDGPLTGLFLGATGGGSIDGTAFVEETPGDTEFWNTASLDISSLGTADIAQIRFDPVAGVGLNYQLDYVRVSGAPVPEPSTLALLGLLSVAAVGRMRRAVR